MAVKTKKEILLSVKEGELKNLKMVVEVNGREMSGCACCICSPEVKGAGSSTANISGSGRAAGMLVVVGNVTSKL